MPNILIVEDDIADQFLHEATVMEGFPDAKIYFARDGEEALQYIVEDSIYIDLILLDINMPRMNGLEFLEKYRELTGAPKIPVVVLLTSSYQDEDKKSASDYECVKDYLTKPLTPEQLNSLKKLLGNL